ncbi:FG-GAP-like repeat-containing protein [Sinomonas flava]|uniref:FG-GAP-like repeat-containing protein n=1 Tax=Sinomonas flava TaxID=496857 RepID=UPI0039A5FDFB
MVTADPRSGAPARLRRLAAVVLSAILGAVLLAPAAHAADPEAPVLTLIQPPAEAVVPGQPAAVTFTASAPVTFVVFHFRDAYTRETVRAEWTGPGTTTASVAPITAKTISLSGTHQLTDVYVAGGGLARFVHRGEEPAGSAPLSSGDLQIDNPNPTLADFPAYTPVIKEERVPGLRLSIANPVTVWPAGAEISYQWFSDGQPIPGATNPDYGLGLSEAGTTITLTISATAPSYRPAQFTSAPYGPAARTVLVPRVVMAGNAAVGGSIRPEFGSPVPPSVIPDGGTPSYTYLWKRDGAPIPGAVQPQYTVTADDVAHLLSVDFTLSYDGGLSSKTVTTPAVRARAAAQTSGFDADGRADVFARTADGTLMLYPGNGAGGWLPARAIGWGWGGFDKLLAPGDFDGDGAADVLARDAAGRLFLYAGNGAGGWKGSRQVGAGWQGMKDIVGAGDFTGDGFNDVLARTAQNTIVVYPGDGRGGWLAPATVGWGWDGLDQLTAVDMDGDFKPDLVARDQQGSLRLFRGDGAGGFMNVSAQTIGTGWSFARIGTVGDFTGDGDPDVFAVDGGGSLSMYLTNATALGRSLAEGYWKGASKVGWGWGGFTAVF